MTSRRKSEKTSLLKLYAHLDHSSQASPAPSPPSGALIQNRVRIFESDTTTPEFPDDCSLRSTMAVQTLSLLTGFWVLRDFARGGTILLGMIRSP